MESWAESHGTVSNQYWVESRWVAMRQPRAIARESGVESGDTMSRGARRAMSSSTVLAARRKGVVRGMDAKRSNWVTHA